MPPQTRSRGVPPPSRVYHSTPSQQQVQFPPRKKVVRTYGKQTRKKDNVAPARSLRQQTLTQIDFVSSFEEDRDPVVLSDSEEDKESEQEDDDDSVEEDEDKENRNVQHDAIPEEEEEEEEEDDEPVSSGRKRRAASSRATTKSARSKRRRTVGDESDAESADNEPKETRRKTLGDLPTSSYHTQTLTQFLGRDPSPALYIRDSEEEDDGFEDWLQDPASPSPLRRKNMGSSPATARRLQFVSPKGKGTQSRTEAPVAERQESIVPQTPIKGHTPAKAHTNSKEQTPTKPKTRDEIPSSISSSRLTTPASIPTPVHRMIDRYGPPDQNGTPVKNKSSPVPKSILKEFPGKARPRSSLTPRKKEVVIQDSFATASWDKDEPTPRQNRNLESPSANRTGAESSSTLYELDTPTKPPRRRQSTELGDNKTASPTPRKRFSPRKGKRVSLEEIPDSDADDDDFDVFDENQENQDEDEFLVGPETQVVMSEIASSAESAKSKGTPPTIAAGEGPGVIVASSTETTRTIRRPTTSSPTLEAALSSATTLPPSSPPRPVAERRRVRQPLHEPTLHTTTQTQPLESQRVPLNTLQDLPSPSSRSDVVLPLSQNVLLDVVEGYQAHINLAFRVPAQVVRFWLFDGELLRYMACAEAGRLDGVRNYRYALTQVYELNNPVEEDDMREEGYLNGEIGRYTYLPPAVVGQLMWNLRHAVFREVDAHPESTGEADDEEEQVQLLPPSPGPKAKNPTPTPSISVSQQVEAQLQSDMAQSTQFPTSDDILVPSTPEDEGNQQTISISSSSTPKKASFGKPTETCKPPQLPPLTPFTRSSYRASRPPLNPVRPSQATTVSQASTPEKNSSSHRLPSFPQLHSSSSLVFNDDSPLHLPSDFASGVGNSGEVRESQLLTKSQTLPDSLIGDDERVPPEIWDSDDDVDARL